MVKYRLLYFNMMGRAEIARLLFAQAGVEYEDVRLTPEEWAKMKPNTPFDQLPILEVDGVQYCQSAAIGGYLAREFNLAGKTNLEKMRADMVTFCLEDLVMKLPFTEKDEKKKAEGMKEAFTVVMPPLIEKIEAMLKQNNGGDGYFLSQLSFVDIAWMRAAQFFEAYAPGILSHAPKLAALAKKVASQPKIKAWIATRPKTEL